MIAFFVLLLPGAGHANGFIDIYKTQCPGRWESQSCLKTVSSVTAMMAKDYMDVLQKYGQGPAMQTVRQECAAATVAVQANYPAEAMRSAFTVCANKLYEIADQTNINPDSTSYQMLVGAVMCLSKDPRCQSIESQLTR